MAAAAEILSLTIPLGINQPAHSPTTPTHRRPITALSQPAQDARVARTAEALSAMKLLKACAWEPLFSERIRSARAAELRQLRVSVALEMLFGVLWECVPLLVALVTFTVFSVTGGTLTAPRIFTALALFDIIRFPLLVFPELVSQARARTGARNPVRFDSPGVDCRRRNVKSGFHCVIVLCVSTDRWLACPCR